MGLKRVLAFDVVDDPVVAHGAAEFSGGFEEGTIRFFDRVLPHCRRMIDFGAYIGFTALHAASHYAEVFAYEPNPAAHDLLVRNVAANPGLAARMHLFRHGIGAEDSDVMLFTKAHADSGSSIFQTIEREAQVVGRPCGTIRLAAAGPLLRALDIGPRTLIKMDIEGAEYQVLPAIAPLLAERQPWLHVSFHPFNLVHDGGPYRTELLRLRKALDVAEALAAYPFRHVWSHGAWDTIGMGGRMDFLRQYLMRAKPLPRIRSPQYGFVDSLAFSGEVLP